MLNFNYSIPTKIHFGKGEISHLTEIADYGKRVLLVYGGGSIKKIGLYDKVISILKNSEIEITELSGVEPNPRIESVREGAELCKANNIDAVLAVGGGSVIDCAKVIAAGAKYDGDSWDLVVDGSKIKEALPVFSVLTLSATGSEMDSYAVISDLSRNDKLGTGSELLKPKMSVLDPEYTYTVSKKQTAAGTADIMSHIFENYFTNVKGAFVQEKFCEGLLKTCIKYGPVALKQPDNYEARANLMWTSSLAINGILSYGANVSWCVHPMEHELSAFYDITHGEGLAILTPNWMEYILSEKTADAFANYGKNVWDIPKDTDKITAAKQAIQKTREFFEIMELPKTLTDVGIDSSKLEIMAEKAADGIGDSFVPLNKEDVLNIYKMSL